MIHDLQREICAQSDERSIAVYQAFGNEIADEALALGHFGTGFRLNRMSWIKTSFGWMLHRSGYATKYGQERILQIMVAKSRFAEIVLMAIPSSFDASRYSSEQEWRQAMAHSDVRIQWDPDRDWQGRIIGRRAIQLGLGGDTLRKYAREWILQIRDVTAIARSAMTARCDGHAPLGLPVERPYIVGGS